MSFGFLVYDGIEELDLFGPWEMASLWSRYLNGPAHCFSVAQSLATIKCNMGTQLVPDHSFATCPALDYLLVPGGEGSRAAAANAAVLEFVRSRAVNCKAVMSVCTGAFVLHAAGLLAGQQATTHWGAMSELRRHTDVQAVDSRFVRSGKVWTAAGVSSGIDMMLAFIAAEAGDETAGRVQLYAEYYPSAVRYGSAHLSTQAPRYLAAVEALR